MKKLILFIHGLGGSEETWGKFETLIKAEKCLNGLDIAFYNYRSSLVRTKSILSIFSKIFSFFIPQKRLPKIQDVAELLKTEIEERYASYDEIYLITHSMGGLVARKYLYDMLKNNKTLQVKKLMLYAVPNNGSDWAKLSKIYTHEQIEQLDRDSDFIQHLNKEVDSINIENYMDVLYIIGKFDNVVNESSAKGYWGNKKVKALPNTHINIVKPNTRNDLSFLVLKNFLCNSETLSNIHTSSYYTELVATPFTKKVLTTLESERLIVCYTQDYNHITKEQKILEAMAKKQFKKNFYKVEVPSFQSDEAKYFQYLMTSAGLKYKVNSANEWKIGMKKRLSQNKDRVLFLFKDIANGDIKLDKKMARIIRSLQRDYNNFYAICLGGKDLAYLVHGNDILSPLNIAKEIFFPLHIKNMDRSTIIQILNHPKNDIKLMCECLEDDWSENWTTWSREPTLNRLFWKNILRRKKGKYVWQEGSKEIAKEIFDCEKQICHLNNQTKYTEQA